jgi:hypothetical protein
VLVFILGNDSDARLLDIANRFNRLPIAGKGFGRADCLCFRFLRNSTAFHLIHYFHYFFNWGRGMMALLKGHHRRPVMAFLFFGQIEPDWQAIRIELHCKLNRGDLT